MEASKPSILGIHSLQYSRQSAKQHQKTDERLGTPSLNLHDFYNIYIAYMCFQYSFIALCVVILAVATNSLLFLQWHAPYASPMAVATPSLLFWGHFGGVAISFKLIYCFYNCMTLMLLERQLSLCHRSFCGLFCGVATNCCHFSTLPIIF